jgi:poly(A) polymerase
VQPKIYTKNQHGIQLHQIDRNALYVLEKLRDAGHIAYLVGGSVRDLLLSSKPKDFDISTSAKPEEIKEIFPNCILIGKRFRLAHIRFGKKVLEVATFRSGDIESKELILRDNIWGSPEEDVLRRDFSINGLYYDDAQESIIDYVGGFEDVQKKFLRTIGNPFLRFKQDPVRMIRLLKFIVRLDFDADKEAMQALLECRGDILKSSPVRVLEELLRMLESGCAKKFLQLMAENYLLQILLPVIGEYLETNLKNEIFGFLSKADELILSNPKKRVRRAILLSCLVFPLLKLKIEKKYVDLQKIPHLGQIQDEVFALINEVFNVYLRLPKRYKNQVMAILTSQYRMIPLNKKKSKKIRIPKVADFQLALDFLAIRASLNPKYTETYKKWRQAFLNQPKENQKSRRRQKEHETKRI